MCPQRPLSVSWPPDLRDNRSKKRSWDFSKAPSPGSQLMNPVEKEKEAQSDESWRTGSWRAAQHERMMRGKHGT